MPFIKIFFKKRKRIFFQTLFRLKKSKNSYKKNIKNKIIRQYEKILKSIEKAKENIKDEIRKIKKEKI